VTDQPTVGAVVPAPNDLTSFFWEGAKADKLVMQCCNSCQKFQHPPEPICHHCLSFDLGHKALSGRATVYSYEIATQAFHPYFADKLPFVLAVVELVEQPNLKMITNLIEFPLDGIEIGAAVQVAFRPLDDEFNLPVFRPAD